MKPTSTVSEKKPTAVPARTSHAASAIAATMSASAAASAACRAGSPALRSPTDAPTSSDSADVTVMTVCRELQKIQNTSPENRQAYRPASGGSPASDASPMPAGSRYAASVSPATKSAFTFTFRV